MKAGILALQAVAFLTASATAGPTLNQAAGHTNPRDGLQCKKCEPAYRQAKKYLLSNLGKASFMEKLAVGFLLLADGGHPDELQQCVNEALRTPGMVGTSKWSNWYLGMGGIFLAEHYRVNPTEPVKEALVKVIEEAAKVQEPTGGWFSSFGAAKKAKYPAEDHGQLTAMLYATMLHMKTAKIPVAPGVLERTEQYFQKQCTAAGIGYGTGNPSEDTTGSRGCFALLGLIPAGRTDHQIYRVYTQILPRCFPRLDKGHHIGGWHFLGTVLGCHRIGPWMFDKLAQAWLDKCIAGQDAEGGFYIGDDGASGGEKGLFGGNLASTSAMALLILLQDPNRLKPAPPRKNDKEKGKDKKPSPFSRPQPKRKPK